VEQEEIDAEIQHYYSSVFDEDARLTTRSAQSALEFVRVQELVRDRIAPGSRVLDIGGATGVHAAPLAAAGPEVTLIDPVEAQVAAALRHETFHAEVGDARRLRFADDSFDVALLFGPLYHLQSREDRLAALGEAVRAGRPVAGGRFPSGHFHTAEELETELLGLALEQSSDGDEELLQAALTIARRTGHLAGIRDMSNHLMGVGRV
jgi:SAM-dependent methyltransferase